MTEITKIKLCHCPYCKVVFKVKDEQNVLDHFVYQHDLDRKTTFEALKNRFLAIGVDIIGEYDE